MRELFVGLTNIGSCDDHPEAKLFVYLAQEVKEINTKNPSGPKTFCLSCLVLDKISSGLK